MERVVLVTGAGSGIGLASALEAARLGFSVVAGVHEASELDGVREAAAAAHLPAGSVDAEVLDVTDEGAARTLIEARQPWALVNNAAVVNAGLLADVTPDEARHQFEVMVFAPMRLAQLALPGMCRAGGGRIVNVSSIAADTTTPMLGWYQAAKAALSSASSVLRQEAQQLGVDVVVIEPGVIETEIWAKAADDLARRRDASAEPEAYDRAIAAMEEAREHGTDIEEVAQVVGAALHAGHPRFRYRVGAGARALPLVEKVLPTGLRDRFTRAAAAL
jgi:NAD(P)-dependent dehydrogenase (short-subunit alcohol dehydrogenase family)